MTLCRKLFELLSLSAALAELTWPAILNKRHLFRYLQIMFAYFLSFQNQVMIGKWLYSFELN